MPVVDGPVESVEVDSDGVQAVRLAGGRTVEADAVVVAPRFIARAALLTELGVSVVPAPMGTGEAVETSPRGETTVCGVYAAGNVQDVSQQVLQAAAEGSRVAAAINADLAMEDADQAVAAHAGDSAKDWDSRYTTGGHQIWSGEPNGALIALAEHLEPGTALDLGCGEGADAIWLARRGWDVTAVDISAVALDRAHEAAATAGVDVDWVRVEVPNEALPTGPFDLVIAMYPALRRTRGDDAIQAILDTVAPGGTLLVVHHALGDSDDHHPSGFDPADYVQPADVAGHLDDGWTIEIHEQRTRVRPANSPGPDVPDVVLRARRTS